MDWDPEEYLRFADHRGRPFRDLMARVGARSPSTVVDLGCGPGNLTRELADRWPGAQVLGIDSSPEMIDRAQREATDRVRFAVGDLRRWSPPEPVDVLVSNATLQWVPEHLQLLPRWADLLAPGGWLAFQVPANVDEPSHTELAAVCTSERWREQLGDLRVAVRAVEEPGTYLQTLADAGLAADVWEATYQQVLPGEDAVLEWVRGTALRPVLSALDDADQAEFLAEYGARLRRAYPRRPYGTVLPFRRIFAVAHRTRDGG